MGKFSISDALGNAKAYYDERSSAWQRNPWSGFMGQLYIDLNGWLMFMMNVALLNLIWSILTSTSAEVTTKGSLVDRSSTQKCP